MKYGFVYIWFDKKHKRFYIGSHWGTEDDGYICSSSWMKQGYRHRPADFKRRILAQVNDRTCLLTEEHKWLQLIPDAELGKRYYNLTKHHPGHWTSRDDKDSIAAKCAWNKGKKLSKLHREKISQKMKTCHGNSNRSDESRRKNIEHMRRVGSQGFNKGRFYITDGNNNKMIHASTAIPKGWFVGRTISEHHKEKLKLNAANARLRR